MTGIIKNQKSFTHGVIKPNGLIKSPTIQTLQTYRYWRVLKTNTPSGGWYHAELYVQLNGTPVAVTAAMLSQSGLQGFSAANLIDGNTATDGFFTDTSPAGSYLKIDFGAGNEQDLDYWGFYIRGGSANAIWDVERSMDGIIWNKAATGFDVSGGAGLKTITWTAT